MIGTLVGFREVCVTVLEIPTGAIADVSGRRWAMVFSHAAYVLAFLAFGLTSTVAPLFLGMFAFAIGEAFRTGTHKAMIFSWLKNEGREKEKTEVYGLTRSWSQAGSAVSTVIAALLVFVLNDYSAIFWLSIIPTSMNIINFLSYPKFLDGKSTGSGGISEIFAVSWTSVLDCFHKPYLRRPIFESVGFEGMYSASKDYLQAVLQNSVLAFSFLSTLDSTRRTTVLIAAAYTTLYLLSSIASRRAGRIAQYLGGDVLASRRLWNLFGFAFLILFVGTLTQWMIIATVGFVFLALLQNVWRPILIARVATEATESTMATVLSVESLAKSLGAAILAPLIGWFVDLAPERYQFAPIAMVGMSIAIVAWLMVPRDPIGHI